MECECRTVVSEASSYMTSKTLEGCGKSPHSIRGEGGEDLGEEHEESKRVESADLPFRVSVFNVISVRELLKEMVEGELGGTKDDDCGIRSKEGVSHGVKIAFSDEEVGCVGGRRRQGEVEEGGGVSSEGVESAYNEIFIVRVLKLAQHIDGIVEDLRKALREEWDGLVVTFPKIRPVAACMEG